MLLIPRYSEPLDQLANRISMAAAPNRNVFDDLSARFGALQRMGSIPHFNAWCESRAWVEAALVMVANELPEWSIRRLIKDGGVWFCALSRLPDIPLGFDDMIEASHEDMALAILAALVEAKRADPVAASAAKAKPRTVASNSIRICCDNFA
jgi:hypothetical protein